MKNKLLFLFAITLFLTGSVLAQVDINTSTYTYGRSGFGIPALTAPIILVGDSSDNVASPVTNIGFTFWFAGTPYTEFSVSDNGLMTLGSTQISGTDVTNNMTSVATSPKIAPYWDDLATGTDGYVQYVVAGASPNRTLTIHWKVTVPKNAGGASNALIQVILSETSGNISFTYGFPAVPVNANGYTIGIGKSATDFASITPASATVASVAYGVSSNNNTMSPGGNTRYSFFTDRTAPTISVSTIPNGPGIQDRTITKTIADAKTGVPLTGEFVPRIYFKKTTDATYVDTVGVLQSGNSASGIWLFTIYHSLLTNVVPGDQINYFVVAQDQATTVGVPNILSSPAGVVATNVNTIVSPPTPSTYTIGASFAGTRTVGLGGDYTSLTSAGGLFEQLNAGQLSGNLTINIISDLVETGIVALNKLVSGAGGPYTITINPAGARTINLAPNGIRLSGSDGITIDGLNDGTNKLTILGGIKFYLGASNNMFTRLTLTGSGINSTDASGTFPVNCSNNTISQCIIDGGNIYFGSWVSASGTNNSITNNVIRNFGQYGIQLDRGYSNFTISGNDIYKTAGSGYCTGIYATPSTSLGTVNIFNNKIHDLTSGTSLGMSTSGIFYSATGTYNIYNNEISLEATTTNTQADKIYGIVSGSAGTSNIYHNSIYIGGTGVTQGNSVGFYRTAGTVNFKNNAVYNARSGAVVSQYYKNFGVVTANLTGFVSDNNLIYADGISNMLFNIGGQPGYAAGTDYATLALWQAASGKDANSQSVNPLFTTVTYLKPLNPDLNAGTPIPGITTDITGLTRDLIAPTIGAYEIPCTNPTSGGTIVAPLTSVGCDPFDPATIDGTDPPLGGSGGLVYQWQLSTTGETGVFTTVSPEINTESYDPGPLSVTTWFKRVARVACKGSWAGAAHSNVVMITVNPVPAVTTANTASVCNGTSPAINLTATVPSTFTWTVVAVNGIVTGAVSGSGAIIDQMLTNAGPSAGTIQYIVIPTSVAGLCPGAAYPITVTVNPIKAVSLSILASQNPFCSGTLVNFAAFPTNGGALPSFVWKVNGEPNGATNTFSYMPLQGHLVTCELTPGNDITCPSVTMAESNAITMIANTSITPAISIGTTTTTVCAGDSVKFTATVTNEGLTPTYVWKVNGNAKVNNSPLFAYKAEGYLTQTMDVVTCELNSSSACVTGNPAISNPVNVTVNPIPVLNPITGEAITCAGTMAAAYGVTTDNSATASYAWSYSGLGATLSATSGSAITINFASNATNGILTVVETNSATGCSTVNTQAITINQCFITLNLKLFFEGLYVDGGTMNPAWNAFGSQYGPGIADVVSVDLHDPGNFATVHYTLNNVEISTSGTAKLLIPGTYNGTYYLSFHHRNSIETITALQVSLGTPVVNYDFTTAATQAYGNNMKQMPDGKWALYGGDANGDGAIDGLDLIAVENDAAAFNTGYILSDANGDGTVDGFDLILIENNATGFVQVITP